MATLDLDCDRVDTISVINVAGELDLGTVSALSDLARQELESDTCKTVILNLKGLEFLDSTGLGCLVQLHNCAKQLDKGLQLRDVPATTQRLLTLGGLASLFGLESTPPE